MIIGSLLLGAILLFVLAVHAYGKEAPVAGHQRLRKSFLILSPLPLVISLSLRTGVSHLLLWGTLAFSLLLTLGGIYLISKCAEGKPKLPLILGACLAGLPVAMVLPWVLVNLEIPR